MILARIRAAFRNLFRKSGVEARLEAEIRSYGDLLTDQNIAAGLAAAEARRLALAQSGGLEQIKQSVRDRRGGIAPGVLAPSALAALLLARRAMKIDPLTALRYE